MNTDNESSKVPEGTIALRTESRDANVMMPRAVKLKDAAKIIGGISEKTVARLVARGLLKRVHGIRHVVITMESINRFLAK